MEAPMKNRNTLALCLLVLLLSSAVALSNAFANAPAAVSAGAEEVVKKTSSEMAKDAAGEVADSAKEKAIGMAKDQANKLLILGWTKLVSP